MAIADRLRLAVFIDFDNIEIGVKNTLNASFDASLVFEALKERGEVVSKTAYSDWGRAGGYSRMLTQHAIRMVQRSMTPGGDKNGADINLALDALEMAFTHPHINAFVIVGGDSDFISLVEKLKQYDKKVLIVGGRQFTSGILQRNCHEFIAYENLLAAAPQSSHSSHRPARGHDQRPARPVSERAPIDQAVPLVKRGLKVLADRELVGHLGLLKSTLLQLDSTFSERSYGAGSFRDFAEKLQAIGVVRLTQTKGGWLVEPVDGLTESMDAGTTSPEDAGGGEPPAASPSHSASSHASSRGASHATTHSASHAAAVTLGTPADGIREFRRVLESTTVRRWPLYLRNVRDLLRHANPPLEGQAYGFDSLVDLLRAAHREGIVRVDRDRQGVVRVFQGASTPAPVTTAPESIEPPALEEAPDLPVEPSDTHEFEPAADAQLADETSGNAAYAHGEPDERAAEATSEEEQPTEPAAPRAKSSRRRSTSGSSSPTRRRRSTKTAK